MIAVTGVSMRFGSKILFEDVTTTFQAGRRYGLTGPNGAGKSTFMKLLTGEQPPQKGNVVRPKKLGVLKQDQFAYDKLRVIDTVIMGNQRLWSALEERDFLYAKPEMTDDDGMRLGELEGIVGDEDGYEAESNAAILLQGLDIPDALHDRIGELHRLHLAAVDGAHVRVAGPRRYGKTSILLAHEANLDAAGYFDLQVGAKRTATPARQTILHRDEDVAADRLVRDRAAGHGDWLEAVEFPAEFLPFLPGEELCD